jgi:hypothetical protein
LEYSLGRREGEEERGGGKGAAGKGGKGHLGVLRVGCTLRHTNQERGGGGGKGCCTPSAPRSGS